MMENPGNSSRSLLDPEQVKMLIEATTGDSPELFIEILELFESESAVKFKELHAARGAGDYEAFSRAVHAISGSSANIGGRTVWLKARDMENLCKSGHGAEAVRQLEELEALHKETLLQLRQFVNQPGS